jgi:opacity protein-like surface antigen
MRFPLRTLPIAALLLTLAFASYSAQAQNILRNSEASVSAFAQFSPDTSGNGITDDPTRSAGGQIAFRHSYHWWLGYEGSYDFTRFAERYSGQPYSYQHNMHEAGASYLVSAPVGFLGFKPFALAGISGVIFSPSLNGGQNVSWQGRPGLNFGAGFDHPLLTDHIGIRIQYRGVFYKTPDFGEAALTTNTTRLTSEPMAGAYLRF